MLPSWLRQFKKRLGGQGARTPRRVRPLTVSETFLDLEPLEDRTVPAVRTWTGQAIADANGVLVLNPTPGTLIHTARWSNPRNWDTGIPQPGDDVVFPAGLDSNHKPPAIVGPPFSWQVNSEIDLYTDNNGILRNFDINNLTILDDNYHIDFFPGDSPSPPRDGTATPQLTIRGEVHSNIPVAVSAGKGLSLIGPLGAGPGPLSILMVGAAQSLRADGPGILKINVPIGENTLLSGGQPVGLQMNGQGTMMLSGLNTFRGDVTVNTGTLLIGNANALGTADRGTFVVNGATLAMTGSSGVMDSIRIIGNGNGGIGAISGQTDPLSTFSAGQVNTHVGPSTISGDVNLQASAAIGTFASSITITGRVTGGGDLTKLGGSTLTLANNDEYTGQTLVQAGTLAIRANQSLGLPNLPTDDPALTGTTVFAGATLAMIGDISVPENLILNGGTLYLTGQGAKGFWLGTITLLADSSVGVVNSATLNDFNTTTLTLAGELFGSAQMNKIDQGRVRIARSNPNFAGSTLVSNGVLQVADGLALGPAGGGPVTVTVPGANVQGTLRLEGTYDFPKQIILNGLGFNSEGALRVIQNPTNAASNITASGNITLGTETAIRVDPISTLTNTGVIDGGLTANLSKQGLGTIVFAGDNSYLGNTAVVEGTAVLVTAGGLGGAGGNGTQVGKDATLRLAGPLDVVGEDLTITGQGVNALGAFQVPAGNSSWSGLVTLNGVGSSEGDINVAAGGSMNFTNVLSGNADLRKLGLGTLVLSGSAPNTFVRSTFLDAGAIVLAKDPGLNALSGTIIVGDTKGGDNADVLQLANSEQIPNTATVIVRDSGLFDLNNNVETLGGLNAVSLQGGEVRTGATGVLVSSGPNGAVSVGGSADTTRLSGNFDLGGVTRVFNFAATPPLSIQSSRNISTFGSAVTFTIVAQANPGVGTPGGSVQFFDNGVLLDTRSLVGGTASTTTSALTPGTHVITANYLGDGSYPPVSITLAPNQLIVNPIAQTVLSTNVNPASPLQPIVFNFRVIDPLNANTPTGTAEFFDTLNGVTQSLGVVPLTFGSASLQVPSLPTGQHTIVARYSGDTIFAPSETTLSPTLQVGTNVVATLNSNASPALLGQPVTFTYQAMQSGGGATPTGTVTFFANGVQIGNPVSLDANGLATYTTIPADLPSANPGTYNITASYSGDGFYVPGITTLIPQLQVVNPLVGRLTANPGTDPQIVGSNSTLTFQANGLPGQPVPQGTVNIIINGSNFGSGTLVNGVATIPISLAAGSYSATANFVSSDTNYADRAGIATLDPGLTFIPNTTPLILSTNNNAALSNEAITLSVRSFTAFGTVNFFVDGRQLNALPIALNQILNVSTLPNQLPATVTIPANTLPAGQHVVTIDFFPSPGSPVGAIRGQRLSPDLFVVNPIDGLLTADTSQANLLNPVTFTYRTITLTSQGQPVATGGTVTFRDGANVLGVVNLVGGVAQLTTTNLGPGQRNITATYSGNSGQGYNAQSATLTPPLTVSTNPLQALLTSSRNAARAGDIVTFTYTALGNVGQQPPTGTVTFFDTYTDNGNPARTRTTQIGNVQNLIGSMASVDTSALLPGTHIITARYDPYPGDLVYSTSTTTISPIQIILTPVTTQFFSDAPFDPATGKPTQQVGSNVTFTAQLTTTFDPTQPTTPTGTVQFFDDFTNSMGQTMTTSLGTVVLPPPPVAPPAPPIGQPPPQVPPPPPVTVTRTAQVTTNGLALGTHVIRAVYSGDFRYEPTTLILPSQVITASTPPPVSLPATTLAARQPNAVVDATISGSAPAGNPKPGIIKAGVGTMALTGQSTYTGSTTEAGGTLLLSRTNTLPTGTDLIINAGTVAVNGVAQTVASLSGAAPGTLSFADANSGLAAGGSNASTAYPGRISGPGFLTKVGTGTLTLSGPGTGGTVPDFTGVLYDLAGTLLVNSNLSASTSFVGSGATLGGTGSVGTLQVATPLGNGQFTTGGTVAPGTPGAVGTLTTGAVTFNGGVYSADLKKDGTNTQSSDNLVVASVGVAPGAPNPFLQLNTALYSNMLLSDAPFTILTSTAPLPAGFRFNKLNADGTPARNADGSFVAINSGDNVVVNGRAYTIVYNANTVTAEFAGLVTVGTVTASPNPSDPNAPVAITVKFGRATINDPVPQGTVTFTDSAGGTFTVPVTSSDASNLIVTTTGTFPTLGAHVVTATFTPTDGRYTPTTVQYTQSVNLATTTTLQVSTTSAAFGQAVTFTAHVAAASGVPTGSFTFYNATTNRVLGVVGLDATGTASIVVSDLESGTNTIQAIYSGDATYRTSADQVVVSVAQEVKPPFYTNAFVIGNFLVLQGNGLPNGIAILPVPPGTAALFQDINGDGKGDVILILPTAIIAVDGQTGAPIALFADINGDGVRDFLLFNPDGTTTRVF